jgi:hypothetical protein
MRTKKPGVLRHRVLSLQEGLEGCGVRRTNEAGALSRPSDWRGNCALRSSEVAGRIDCMRRTWERSSKRNQ